MCIRDRYKTQLKKNGVKLMSATEIYTLSLHDALPILPIRVGATVPGTSTSTSSSAACVSAPWNGDVYKRQVLLCGAEFTQFDLRFLVAGIEPVFLRGKGLIFGIQLFEVRQCPEPVGLEIGASGLVHGKLCTVLLLELGGIPHSLELLCKEERNHAVPQQEVK